MPQRKSICAIVGMGFLLTACGVTYDYEGLRETNFRGTGFDSALAREYQKLALFEADEMYDWRDAANFGHKAIAAGKGRWVPPEVLSARRIPGSKRGAMAAAYADLQHYLRSDAVRRYPETTARAQAMFDCWVEQQEENWQTDHIEFCRTGLRAALLTLEGKSELGSTIYPAPSIQPARDNQSLDLERPSVEAVTLFFSFDSAELDEESQAALDRVAGSLRNASTTTVFIGGHADRAGPDPYNRTLSALRVSAVRKALRDAGIADKRIHSRAFGEARPRILTPDGVREPRNRRVEIIIDDGPAL